KKYGHYAEDDGQLRTLAIQHQAGNAAGNARGGNKGAEDEGTDDDDVEHARRAQAIHQGMFEGRPAQALAQYADDDGPERADRAGFRWCKPARQQAADHQNNQHGDIADSFQRRPAFRPGGLLNGGAERRLPAAQDDDGDDVEQGLQNTGDHAGRKQFADGLLGENAVDDEHAAGRNQAAHGSAGSDATGGKARRVVVLAHFRYGYHAHGGGGGEARAADRTEAGAATHGGHGQSTPVVAPEFCRCRKEVAARAGGKADVSHEQKQGQYAELIVGGNLEADDAALDECCLGGNKDAQSGEAHRAEGEADGHSAGE